MALEPVGPEDCTLLVCLPLTEDEFLADLGQVARGDYARGVWESNREQWAKPADLWGGLLGPVVGTTKRLAAEAAAAGARVILGATFDDFKNALQSARVVTLVAHCRYPPFEEADIRDLETLLQKTLVPRGRPHLALRRALEERLQCGSRSAFKSNASMRVDSAVVVRCLNHLVGRAHGWYDQVNGRSSDGWEEATQRLTRVAFESAFRAELRPAKVMEFRDAMQTIWDLVDAVPMGFSGVLDLTSCRSVILANLIKQTRRCLVVANPYPVDPDVRLLEYKMVIEELREQRAAYVDTLVRVHRDLIRIAECRAQR